MKKEKELKDFITLIPKLEPIEFIGLSKILCVDLIDDKQEPRPFEDILTDMMEKLSSIGRKPRREILKITKQAAKGWREKDGNATKDQD